MEEKICMNPFIVEMNLNLMEQKMLSYLLTRPTQDGEFMLIPEYRESIGEETDPIFYKRRIGLSELIKQCGFPKNGSRGNIEKAGTVLGPSILRFSKRRTLFCAPWFSYFSYVYGCFNYKLNNSIMKAPELLNDGKFFMSIDPEILPLFKSKHGIHLYILMKNNFLNNRNPVFYSVKNFNQIMNPNKRTYDPKVYKDALYKQKIGIVEPAIKEVNSITDIHIDYEQAEINGIKGWKFTIKEKNEEHE